MQPVEWLGLPAAWPHYLSANSLPLFDPCLFLEIYQNIAKHSRREGFCGDPIVHTGAEQQQKDTLRPAPHSSCSSSVLLSHRSDPMWEDLGRTLLCLFLNRDPCILQADGWPESGHEEMGVGPFSSHLGFCNGPQVLPRGNLGTQGELACSHLIPMVI